MTPKPRRSRSCFEPNAMWPDTQGGECIMTQVHGPDTRPRLILGRFGHAMMLDPMDVRIMLPYLQNFANRGNLLPWPSDMIHDWSI